MVLIRHLHTWLILCITPVNVKAERSMWSHRTPVDLLMTFQNCRMKSWAQLRWWEFCLQVPRSKDFTLCFYIFHEALEQSLLQQSQTSINIYYTFPSNLELVQLLEIWCQNTMKSTAIPQEVWFFD